MQGNSLFVFVKILRFLNLWQVPQNILRSFTNRNCSFYIFASLCQILTMRKNICKLLSQNKQKMNVLILQFLNCFSVFFIYTENSGSFQGLWVDFEPPRASCTVHIHTDNIGQNRTVNQMKNLLLLKYIRVQGYTFFYSSIETAFPSKVHSICVVSLKIEPIFSDHYVSHC